MEIIGRTCTRKLVRKGISKKCITKILKKTDTNNYKKWGEISLIRNTYGK